MPFARPYALILAPLARDRYIDPCPEREHLMVRVRGDSARAIVEDGFRLALTVDGSSNCLGIRHPLDRSMSAKRIKLFLSHASEDKAEIAEPLYQALKDEFEVWYDKARLTLGDSFYEKISEGIRGCDFGIVIFSPSFAKKHWPQDELDGLRALQTKERKVILPVVHKMTFQEMAEIFPIAAGKLAIQSSEGISAIVAAIRSAVGTAEEIKGFDESELENVFAKYDADFSTQIPK